MEKLPIVYLRGYAGGTGGIDKQVDDPFYGFNDGSTHVRVDGDGDPRFYQFESPMLRLINDEKYQVLVRGNQEAYLQSRADDSVPAETIWVHRFYDPSASTFGAQPVEFDIEDAAKALYDFVQLVIAKTKEATKVFLVAHSMGGLVCRCMLQKVSLMKDSQGRQRTPGRDIVDRLFTFGTPHGGITFGKGGGLVDWAMETFGPSGADIFAPAKMYGYLTPRAKWGDRAPERWDPRNVPAEDFDPKRIFCLIGTDSADYGLAKVVVGPKSDGLVMIDNAYVRNSHRGFVHRSHSGRYGLVNSEEGYQNLRRFLFGSLEVKVELLGLNLPDSKPDEKEVWQADVRLRIRGLPILMHEQTAEHYCPVQLVLEQQRRVDSPDSPVPLTTAFLLDYSRFHDDPLNPPRLRMRYALTLRVLRLVERHGFFNFRDHLEQLADWEDSLIVDIGRSDEQDINTRAWVAWNSAVPGATAERDPIVDAALDISDGVIEIDLPASAKAVMGERARLRVTVVKRN
jgi:pimeloyl-ACP methyl ester carboxylesterase